MTMPYVLSNGPGNFPDADKLMANYDYLENGVTGRTTLRNRIINGDMRIDQRNAGGSITQTTGNTYPVDRWRISGSVASKFSAQRNYSVTSPTGFSNHLGILSLSSYSVGVSEVFTITQAIEGFNIVDFAWGTALAKTVTLSFWFRSNMSGGTVFGGAIQNYAGSRSYPFTFSINNSNAWEYKTITIPGDQSGTWENDSNPGIVLRLCLGAGVTFSGTAGAWASADYRSATGSASVVGTNAATYFITGVQIEAGTLASVFELLPFPIQLALCQRYYEKTYLIGNAPGVASLNGFRLWKRAMNSSEVDGDVFRVEKRSLPTMILFNSIGTSGRVENSSNSATAAYIGTSGFGYANVASGGLTANNPYGYHWTCEAEI